MEQLQQRYNDYLSAKNRNHCITNSAVQGNSEMLSKTNTRVFSYRLSKDLTSICVDLKQYLVLKILE